MTTIVVPTLNEQAALPGTLRSLRALHGRKEIIVSDGGSTDATLAIARSMADRVIEAPRGRGPQMHAGALAAQGEVLWFLHADTIAPPAALAAINHALQPADVVAGSFALQFGGSSRSARQLTAIYPHLRLLGLSYGDSGVFVRSEVYRACGGFRPFPLFEDLDLIRRLKRRGRFAHLDCPLVTSSRRFEDRNFALVFAHWTALQIGYWIGVPPHLLARWYRQAR